MWDLLLRILKHPFDYLPSFRSYELTLVQQVEEGSGVYSFHFVPDTEVTWKAGQHGVFVINGTKDRKGWRAFSIASTPASGHIMIATQIPPQHSEFKASLIAMQPGDTLTMYGPIGEFYLRDDTPVVGIAGGIGITPFMALLAQESTREQSCFKALVYGGRPDYHPFKEQVEGWCGKTSTELSLPTTMEGTAAAIDAVCTKHPDATYFISGSPGMIAGVTKQLRASGIKHIVNDPFKGY